MQHRATRAPSTISRSRACAASERIGTNGASTPDTMPPRTRRPSAHDLSADRLVALALVLGLASAACRSESLHPAGPLVPEAQAPAAATQAPEAAARPATPPRSFETKTIGRDTFATRAAEGRVSPAGEGASPSGSQVTSPSPWSPTPLFGDLNPSPPARGTPLYGDPNPSPPGR